MSVRYLYNSAGDYIAFIRGDHIYTPEGDWIGFVAKGNEVYREDGTFLGYLLDDDRVVRRSNEPTRPRLPRRPRPPRPLPPLRPLRRLRMARLPRPYEDVFEHAPDDSAVLRSGRNVSWRDEGELTSSRDLSWLDGAELRTSAGTLLGFISRQRYDVKSLSNPYGEYGSRYQLNSIFNPYGPYGNPYGVDSPFNPYTITPPSIVKAGRSLAYLTLNKNLKPRLAPDELFAWLQGQ